MDKGICTVEVCPNPAIARGWCVGHYNRWQKNGDPGTTPIAARHRHTPGQMCSVPECPNAAKTRGMCDTHIHRIKVHGDVQADRPIEGQQPGVRPCSIPDCGMPVKGRGWCGKHHRAWLEHGDPLANFRRTRKPCAVPDCPRLADGKGMCPTHRERTQRHGDPLAHIPIDPLGRKPKRPCEIAGCEEWASKRGRCGTHYWHLFQQEIAADPVRYAARRAYQARHHREYVKKNADYIRLRYRLWLYGQSAQDPRERPNADTRTSRQPRTCPSPWSNSRRAWPTSATAAGCAAAPFKRLTT